MTEPQDDGVLEVLASEVEDQESETPIYRIVSYPADYTLSVIYEKWGNKEIVIPLFQRGWVWKHSQASKLVDSFLTGLPVPAIFLYKKPNGEQWVIDGQQRLRTIVGFIDGALPDVKTFYLKSVDPKWEGMTFLTLDVSDRRRFLDCVLRTIIIEQLDPDDDSSMYHIFERLNTGGTGLNAQEVRNCVAYGVFNDLMLALNKNATWRRIFGFEQPDARMRDVELIVRFLALYEGIEGYYKPMKVYLNKFMVRHQHTAAEEPWRSVFESTVERVIASLGDRPFHVRRGINAAVFDSVMMAFAQSQGLPEDAKDRYGNLLKNPSYFEATSGGTTDVDSVKRRVALANQYLFGQ